MRIRVAEDQEEARDGLKGANGGAVEAVLQIGHHEPAITHAAIALGSIHRAITYVSTNGALTIDPDQHFFALGQYNKAMGYIRRYIEGIGDECTRQTGLVSDLDAKRRISTRPDRFLTISEREQGIDIPFRAST